MNRAPMPTRPTKGWCGACNKMSGHWPDACPKRPLAHRIVIVKESERVTIPSGFEPRAGRALDRMLRDLLRR